MMASSQHSGGLLADKAAAFLFALHCSYLISTNRAKELELSNQVFGVLL